ncbi:MAG: hypothetical protein ACJARX_001811 [Psychroserpens sp.]|jgi:hypothetical protein
MLHNTDVDISNGISLNKFKPYASSQGFYKYDLSSNSVFNPFLNQQGITTTFYSTITSLTNNLNIIEVTPFDAQNIYVPMQLITKEQEPDTSQIFLQ